MNHDARTVAEWVREVASELAPVRVMEAVERLLRKPKRPQKRIEVGRMKPTREEYRERTRVLREIVMDLANYRCERCAEPQLLLPSKGHMHHVIGGSGKRRQQQSIENVAWLCADCHRALHREPAAAREFRERLKILRQHPEHRREP